eukprot:SAG11_NODE_33037_length_279_cov_1.011111_1_plen_63_part_10
MFPLEGRGGGHGEGRGQHGGGEQRRRERCGGGGGGSGQRGVADVEMGGGREDVALLEGKLGAA